MLRAPVSLNRLSYDRGRAMVHIEADPSMNQQAVTLDVLDFCARFSVKIPDAQERLTLHHGPFSNASGLRRASAKPTSASANPAAPPKVDGPADQ